MKFQMFLFGCIGIATEITFVALLDNIAGFQEKGFIDPRLIGHSYVWMFFLYMWIPLAYHFVYPKLQHIHLLIRLLIYACLFIVIEFVAGLGLDVCTGICPWDYTGKTIFSILGYTRLDYFPFWMLFGFFCEKICQKLAKHFPQG